MQALVEQLKAQNAAGAGMAIGPSDNMGGGGMDAESARMIAELQEKLAAKQTDLSREMEGEGGGDERADQQRKVNCCALATLIIHPLIPIIPYTLTSYI